MPPGPPSEAETNKPSPAVTEVHWPVLTTEYSIHIYSATIHSTHVSYIFFFKAVTVNPYKSILIFFKKH